MLTSPLTLATVILAVDFIYSFQSHAPNSRKYDIFLPIGTTFPLTMSSTTDNQLQTFEDELESAKIGLMRLCTSDSKASLDDVQRKVRGLEDLAERYGIGQGSSHSGLLSGEWWVLRIAFECWKKKRTNCSCSFFLSHLSSNTNYRELVYSPDDITRGNSIIILLCQVVPTFNIVAY